MTSHVCGRRQGADVFLFQMRVQLQLRKITIFNRIILGLDERVVDPEAIFQRRRHQRFKSHRFGM